jgi:Mce-associated membrane protein
VEDQSTDPGDLTSAPVPQGKAGRNRHRLPRQKAADASAETEETAVAEAPEEVAEPEAVVETEAPASEAPASEAEPEVVLVPHRTAGRALKIVAVVAGALFVAAAAFAGAAIEPYLSDRAAVHTKFVIAETAANAITTLWTYSPDDMDRLPERSAKYLGGDFAVDYKRYIDAIVAPNKQAQVSNNTQVLGAAVESLTSTEATALVYTNSVATSPVTKGIPSLRYLSYRLDMKRDGSRWLITQMVAVTKLDLTPRL